MGYKNNTESEATLFGSAIHKALEHWYCLPEEERSLSDKDSKLADTLVNTKPNDILCLMAHGDASFWPSAVTDIFL